MPPQSLPEVRACATEEPLGEAPGLNRPEPSRARTAAQARSCFLLGSAVCGGAAACARGSPRARNPRGRRIRNLAGGDSEPEQSRLRSRACCTARHSHRTPFFSRRSRSTSSCSHAPRMRRRWSALVLPWTELARFVAAYAAQSLAAAIEAASLLSSPPPSPRFVAAISVAHGAMHYRH